MAFIKYSEVKLNLVGGEKPVWADENISDEESLAKKVANEKAKIEKEDSSSED